MSSNLAKWYHSMTFTYTNEWDAATKKHGTVNTWDDWHLIPTSRPVFNPPPVKTVYIDIPGSDGQIDATEALNGYPVYGNREGSFEFIVANGYRNSWAGGYSKFMNWLHGRNLRCVLDDDPNYYYEGRFSINNWTSNNDGTWSNITIDYNVEPYKISKFLSTDDWLWDPFNFETDIIRSYKDIPVNGIANITIGNDGMHVIPKFILRPAIAGERFILSCNGVVLNNVVGTIDNPRIELLPGENTVEVIGNGTISVQFRGGSL